MSDIPLLAKKETVPLRALLAETAAAFSVTQPGAQYCRKTQSVTFCIWAPTASAVSANIYKDEKQSTPQWVIHLLLDDVTGYWSGSFCETDPDGFFYDYTIQNELGTVTVLDPYARSMAVFTNDGTIGRGAIVDMNAPQSLPPSGMKGKFYPLKKREDAVIYEMSVRDFTADPSAKTTASQGTFSAFIEKIPYLKELGITHVQLMPVLKFYYTDETNQQYENSGKVHGNNYNWGYDPHNYFTPTGWFSTNPADPYCRIRELRTLINECHRANIGVLLDVVYNHMADTRLLNDIVPGYYFRMNEYGFTSDSGCGNDTASERPMMKRLIVDSVRFWVQEYKVDGFRFDLMGLIDAGCIVAAYDAARQINPYTLFIGEGWKMYSGNKTVCMDQNCMNSTNTAGVFNDELRDLLRAGGFNEQAKGFITGNPTDSHQLYNNLLGIPCKHYTSDAPGDNVQYITAHDGLTLHDTIALNCQLDDTKPEHRQEIQKRMKLGLFAILTSQGIAFLHGGEELARTKPNLHNEQNDCIGSFVRNSYRSADNINAIRWEPYAEYASLKTYAAGLIAMRKKYEVFRIGNRTAIEQAGQLLSCTTGSMLCIGYTLCWNEYRWFILINANIEETEFHTDYDLSQAEIFADAETAGTRTIKKPQGITIPNTQTVTLAPLTAAVLRIKTD